MDSSRPTLLLTRPDMAARRFAAEFRARFGADWPVIVAPLMRTRWLQPELPDRRAADIAFTSETAVAGYARLTPDRTARAWCVGPRTADAARAAGFAVITGPGDATGLARCIAAERAGAVVLWPQGSETAHDLRDLLDPAGVETIPLTVYDQRPEPLTDEAKTALAGDRALLLPLFSPRSARLVALAAPIRRAPLFVAAMSRAVAEAAAALAPERLEMAPHPDTPGILTALERLLDARG